MWLLRERKQARFCCHSGFLPQGTFWTKEQGEGFHTEHASKTKGYGDRARGPERLWQLKAVGESSGDKRAPEPLTGRQKREHEIMKIPN